MTPSCQGEMFGHDFPFTGADCTQCGINQKALLPLAHPVFSKKDDSFSASMLARFGSLRQVKKPIRGIHSELHALVDETRKKFGETTKKGVGSFGYYLGYFKRLGIVRVQILLAETRDAAQPKRAFWWKVGDYLKKQKEQQAEDNEKCVGVVTHYPQVKS